MSTSCNYYQTMSNLLKKKILNFFLPLNYHQRYYWHNIAQMISIMQSMFLVFMSP